MSGDRLRGVASLLALSWSYARRRPSRAWSALRVAFDVGRRARTAPVLRPRDGLLARLADIVPVCSLVSDTHLVTAQRAPCELEHEPEQWRGAMPSARDLTAGLQRILEHLARHAPRTVIWCGDEVDTGDPEEWRQWNAIVQAVPGLAHRLVPGNHDVCFNRPFDEDYDLGRRARRERAFQRYAGPLADFPVVDTIVGDAGVVTVALLDSTRHRSTHVLSNAVGLFGDDQLAELARQLAKVRGPVLCIAHHHVWRDARFMEPDAWYNIAIDAEALVAILDAYRARDSRNHVMICHGHRHVLTTGVVGRGVAVVGMPSSTLGDKAGTGVLDGIMRYAVAGVRPTGQWAIVQQEVGALMPAEDYSSSAGWASRKSSIAL
jgi:Calcineurin-like phosphoesterase